MRPHCTVVCSPPRLLRREPMGRYVGSACFRERGHLGAFRRGKHRPTKPDPAAPHPRSRALSRCLESFRAANWLNVRNGSVCDLSSRSKCARAFRVPKSTLRTPACAEASRITAIQCWIGHGLTPIRSGDVRPFALRAVISPKINTLIFQRFQFSSTNRPDTPSLRVRLLPTGVSEESAHIAPCFSAPGGVSRCAPHFPD